MFLDKINIFFLFDLGVHIGHSIKNSLIYSSWFIFSFREGYSLIDLSKFIYFLKIGFLFIDNLVLKKRPIWFVNQHLRFSGVIREMALKCGEFACTLFWVRGLLSNFKVVKALLKSPAFRKNNLQSFVDEPFDKFLRWPGLIFVSSIKTHQIIVTECLVSGFLCLGILDTNTYSHNCILPIPGNDDSLACVSFYNELLSEYILYRKFVFVHLWFVNVRKKNRLIGFNEWVSTRFSYSQKWKPLSFFFKPSFGFYKFAYNFLKLSSSLSLKLNKSFLKNFDFFSINSQKLDFFGESQFHRSFLTFSVFKHIYKESPLKNYLFFFEPAYIEMPTYTDNRTLFFFSSFFYPSFEGRYLISAAMGKNKKHVYFFLYRVAKSLTFFYDFFLRKSEMSFKFFLILYFFSFMLFFLKNNIIFFKMFFQKVFLKNIKKLFYLFSVFNILVPSYFKSHETNLFKSRILNFGRSFFFPFLNVFGSSLKKKVLGSNLYEGHGLSFRVFSNFDSSWFVSGFNFFSAVVFFPSYFWRWGFTNPFNKYFISRFYLKPSYIFKACVSSDIVINLFNKLKFFFPYKGILLSLYKKNSFKKIFRILKNLRLNSIFFKFYWLFFFKGFSSLFFLQFYFLFFSLKPIGFKLFKFRFFKRKLKYYYWNNGFFKKFFVLQKFLVFKKKKLVFLYFYLKFYYYYYFKSINISKDLLVNLRLIFSKRCLITLKKIRILKFFYRISRFNKGKKKGSLKLDRKPVEGDFLFLNGVRFKPFNIFDLIFLKKDDFKWLEKFSISFKNSSKDLKFKLFIFSGFTLNSFFWKLNFFKF